MGFHFLLQEGLPDPGIKPVSLASPELAGGFFITVPHGKPRISMNKNQNSQTFPVESPFYRQGKQTIKIPNIDTIEHPRSYIPEKKKCKRFGSAGSGWVLEL